MRILPVMLCIRIHRVYFSSSECIHVEAVLLYVNTVHSVQHYERYTSALLFLRAVMFWSHDIIRQVGDKINKTDREQHQERERNPEYRSSHVTTIVPFSVG